MRMFKTRLFLFAIVFSLSACTALGVRRPVHPHDRPNIDSPGVSSILGDEIHGISIGTTIFNNDYYVAHVPEWKIDEFTENEIIADLSEYSDFIAAEVAVPEETARKARQSRDHTELLDLAGQQGFDTLLVVRPSRYDNAPHHEGGYGFYRRSAFGLTQQCIYSLFIGRRR